MKHFLVFFGVIFIWLLFSNIIINLSNNVKDSLEHLGQFGDSFNILTSLFTGLAFAGVIISVRLQKEELIEVKKEFEEQTKALENQQKEMAIQSFDNKFFQMLNLFNNIIKELNYEMFLNSIDRTNSPYRPVRNSKQYKGREVLKRIKENLEQTKSSTMEEFQINFDNINQEYKTTLKFYCINLYQIIKYIDLSLKEYEKAKSYTNIIRAQLSKDELVLLFYNIIAIIPFSGENYKVLIEKYAFFEHLTYQDLNPKKNDFIDILLAKYNSNAFGKNKELTNKILILQGQK